MSSVVQYEFFIVICRVLSTLRFLWLIIADLNVLVNFFLDNYSVNIH